MKIFARTILYAHFALFTMMFASCVKEFDYKLTVLVKPSESGTVSAQNYYKEGEAVTLVASANQGYLFVSWTNQLGELSTDSTYTFTMPSNDVEITANFLKINRDTITFQTLSLGANSYWNGSDGSGGFTLNLSTFNNVYNANWSSWSGFAYSNMSDMHTPGFANQYSAYLSAGSNGANIFALAYVTDNDSKVTFTQEVNPVSVMVTNSTYAYLTLRDGDQFSKKFGPNDWFMLTITGYDGSGTAIGSVNFYLADFQSSKSVMVDSWTSVDLSRLKNVSELVFSLSSSDNGDWGMNTPAYFCLDNLVYEY